MAFCQHASMALVSKRFCEQIILEWRFSFFCKVKICYKVVLTLCGGGALCSHQVFYELDRLLRHKGISKVSTLNRNEHRKKVQVVLVICFRLIKESKSTTVHYLWPVRIVNSHIFHNKARKWFSTETFIADET